MSGALLAFLYSAFFAQALLMGADEFYFHRKRGLPRWEIIGHPLDTLSVLACYLFLLYASPTSGNLLIYIFLAGFSCLLVTKDEWIHRERCSPLECWLHSLLFVLHPITLGIAAYLWKHGADLDFIKMQSSAVAAFGIYQIAYWSFSWKKMARA